MKTGLIIVMLCAMTMPAMAYLGLPIADDATTVAGEMRATGGVTFESDVNMYGGRLSYGIADGLSAFAGAGLLDPDFGDSEPYFQAGGTFALPVDLPVDLAIRSAFGIVSGDDWDLWMLNAGALASKAIDHALTAYGFGGLSYKKVEVGRHSDSETELAIAGGVLYALSENLSLYGELAHIDELFFSAGAGWTF